MRILIARLWASAVLVSGTALMPVAAEAAVRSYTLTDFDSVRLEAPIAVAIQAKRGVAARGEGDADLLDRIELNVAANVLTIRLRSSPFAQSGRNAAGPVRLFLSLPKLRRLQLDGSGTLAAEGMEGQRVEIISSGSGRISVGGIASDNLSVAQLGSGSINLAGKSGTAVMRLSGTGALDAGKLTVLDLDFALDGAASAEALATRSAKILAVGSGTVAIDGQPACSVRHTGSGSVTCGGKAF